ncbi:protein kinase [bacterium]|nr:protein kinase [bacterium]
MSRSGTRLSRPFVQVLLIEQDPDTISAVSTLLSEIQECRLHVSSSYSDALLAILENPPNLILFTHGLPGRNSLEVFASIRNKYPSIYLIVTLPAANQDLIDQYKKAGAADCIIKDENYLATLGSDIQKALVQISSNSVSQKTPFVSQKDGSSSDELLSMLSALEPGEKILHYQILDAIGEGGMGEVYKAQDLKLGRIVAIKALPLAISNDEQARRRFMREAQSASRLNHPGIVTIHAIEEVEDFQFIVMEYVEGESLGIVLERGPLPLSRLIAIGSQAAEALGAAHAAGLIHRDIKPANIMITTQDKLKILDFGLAKPISLSEFSVASRVNPEPLETTELTSGGAVLGTVSYMSPEQTRGETLDARTDIFSLGCVLYQAATCKKPFGGASIIATMNEIETSDPSSPSSIQAGLPKEFDDIIAQCLAKDRTLRTLSAQQLAEDLKKLLLSGTPAQQSEGQTQRSIESAGIPRPQSLLLRICTVVIMTILLIAGLRYWENETTGKKAIHSIAVLPFVNAGSDPKTEYLCDGITESLINNLTRVPTLQVMARGTVFAYKTKKVDPRKVGRDLKVDAIVTGSVTQQGEMLIVQADLVNVENGVQLWGDQYNRNFSDILMIQSEISKQIAEQLRLKLTTEQKEKMAKRDTENSEAYQFYLKGRYYWNKRTGESIKRSVEYYKQAVEKDPGYAKAYAAIAEAFVLYNVYDLEQTKTSHQKAREYAKKALSLDDSIAPAHIALALTMINNYNWEEAEREFKRAIEADPNYATAHQWLGINLLLCLGRFDEAISELKKAEQLEPLSLIIGSDLGQVLCWAGRYDEAIAQLKGVLELDGNFFVAHMYLAEAYMLKGSYFEAMAEAETALQLNDTPWAHQMMGKVYAFEGRKGDARKVINKLKELSQRKYLNPENFAELYAVMGDKDQAFQWIQKAYETDTIVGFKANPFYASLRSDPRYSELLHKIRLN